MRMLGVITVYLSITGCGGEQRPNIIAHRAQGVGTHGENIVENVSLCFEAGFGAEIDIRGDGSLEMELGHLEPNGRDLGEVFKTLRSAWEPGFAGRILVIDVANDGGNRVSDGLIRYLHERVPGTELATLRFIIQSSNEESLDRLQAHFDDEPEKLDIAFATTYWTAPELTPPDGLDLVTTHAKELGDAPYPKPVMLFGVESRSVYRSAVRSASEIHAVITDHPRRIAEFQD